jgi:hypothetical protein
MFVPDSCCSGYVAVTDSFEDVNEPSGSIKEK